MYKKEKIHFLITGGTIDSFYDGTKDTVVPNEKSSIPELIKSLKPFDNFKFTQVCMKDSRNLNNDDRKKLLKEIEKSKYDKIIITHGTYTMPDTAKFLEVNLKKKNKTIILTGSMTPLMGFSPSDAPFNLGYSMAKIKELPFGVYICMNARIFTPVETIKAISEGRFYSIFEK